MSGLAAIVERAPRGRANDAGAVSDGSVTLVARQGCALTTRLLAACDDAGRTARIVQSPADRGDGLVIDLTGQVRPKPGQEVWRFTAGGTPLQERHALAGLWHRAPFSAPIELVRINGDGEAAVIAAAHVSTTGGYADLRAKAFATAGILARQAMSAPRARDRLDGSEPKSPPRGSGPWALPGGWLRWQAAKWRSRLFVEWWTVGVCDKPIGDVLRDGELGEVEWLRPRTGANYWADPFAWPGSDRLLCEEYPLAGGPGVIVVLAPDGEGGWARKRTLLGDRLHRSYPFTFQEGGRVYLLPECVAADEAVLYRLADDGGMERVARVARGRLADATVFRDQGRYWVAATDLAIGAHDNLCLFHAERLEGPWRAHRGNPVKIDIRSSRSAGTPFEHEGGLFRPAQDCAGAYGAAVVVNEIVTLTTDEFEERPVLRLAPDPAGVLPHGLHTLSAFGQRTLVDGKRMAPAPMLAVRRIARRLRGVGR